MVNISPLGESSQEPYDFSRGRFSAKDTERIGIGYRFNFVVYDKFVDEDIRCDLLGRTRDIYTNRCWIDSENEPDYPVTSLHWYQQLWSNIKKTVIKKV